MSSSLFRWIGGTGDHFDIAANWYDETTEAPATVAPGPADEAIITASGTIAGPASVAQLGVTGTGSGLTLAGTFTAHTADLDGAVTIGADSRLIGLAAPSTGASTPFLMADTNGTASSTISVMGGLIEDPAAYGVIIGESGAAALSITQQGSQGGTLLTGNPTTGQGLVIADAAGSSGTVSVSGSASGLGVYGTIYDGDAGFGTLTLAAGAHLAAGYAASRYALVVGNGGTGSLALSGYAQASLLGESIVGLNSFGTLSITGGSSFAGTATLGGALVVAAGLGATADVLISDPATYMPLLGALVVADGGQGSVDIENQAIATVSLPGNPFTPGIVIGTYSSGASGTLAVSSGAQLTSSNYVEVGDTGAGALDLSNATLTVSTAYPIYLDEVPAAIEAGVSAGSVGIIDVIGGLIEDTSSTGMIIGAGGAGVLTIAQNGSQGGTVLTGYPYGPGLTVGELAGASGSVSVRGSASGLGVYGSVADGESGDGKITITASARFVAGYAAESFGLTIGNGGTGDFTVSGGAQATVLGAALVGFGSAGSLIVNGGSSFSATSTGVQGLQVGFGTGEQGSVLISDPSTYVPITGGMDVGFGGTGTLTVQNDAVMEVIGAPDPGYPGAILGDGSGSSGTVLVQSGANLLANAGMVVGSSGAGLLEVAAGTFVSSADPAQGLAAISAGASAASSGTILVNGGLIEDTTSAGMVIGDIGDGTLAISQSGSIGGTVLTGDPDASYGLSVGVGARSIGTISVSGSASGLGVYGGVLMGGDGNGAISVSDGAHFVAGSNETSNGLVLGGGGGSGSMSLVNGAQASVIGPTIVGDVGTGTLSITGGSGFVGQASQAFLGFALVVGGTASDPSTGTGSVLISGPSTYASFDNGIGMQAGTFSVLDGAYLDAGNTMSISGGAVTVSGTATTIAVNTILVGNSPDGSGSLSVDAGGIIDASGAVEDSGQLSLAGGTLSTASLNVNAGAVLTGDGTVDAYIAPSEINGSIIASGGTLSLIGSFTGTGSLVVAANSLLALSGSNVFGTLTTETNTIDFQAGGGTLTGPSTAGILGTITGWSAGDFVSLGSIAAATDSFANGTLSLFGTNSQLLGTLNFAGSLATHNFTLTQIAGGTEIGYHP